MLMPKKNRVAIYEYLFKEGVCVAKKDFHLAKHPEIPVPNLHVIKAMQSLVSRDYVKEQFAWKHYYWRLTNEGITYLREFLHLPQEIVPATLKKQQRPDTGRQMPGRGPPTMPQQRFDDSDRMMYRKPGGGGFDKTAEAGVGAGTMEQRRGFGRGRQM